MGDNVRHIMDGGSNTMAPVKSQTNYDANVDYIINEYMERLGTRLNILETELKYAWRALDLLSQEYIKMWERLEKLEGLLYEQQGVISQLLDFYTSGGASGMVPEMGPMLEGRLGELEVIREILGNGTVEDGLEEGLDVSRSSQSAVIQELEMEASMDEMHVPDEAFYRSLNQAYREDLVGGDQSNQGSQLGMIWEEREDNDDGNEKKCLNDGMRIEENDEIYSALDYKDYRGNSPCISEQDIAQLSRIDSIDQVAIEKLNELDRLSNKLHQDSVNIKQLQRKLLESPLNGIVEEVVENKEADNKQVENQLQQIYEEPENWSFSSGVRDQDELMMLAKSELPSSLSNLSYAGRPSSRLSVVNEADKEVAETLAGGIRTPTSPRRRQIEISTCTAPFTTVTGRLAYSAAVQHVESAEAAAAAASKNPFYCSASDLNSLIAASYETVPCSTPNIFNVKSEKAQSPTLSICSIRTRQDGYISSSDVPQEPHLLNQSPSPPPPAPRDICESFLLPNAAGANEATTSQDHRKLSPKTPRSPKSPKSSPKRSKSHSSNIVAAKSDSGLSSMSGWSSLEKSPGSPKNGPKPALNYYGHTPFSNQPTIAPIPVQPETQNNSRPFTESSVDSKLPESHPAGTSAILPGGHHLSAFTTVKSPCSLENSEGYGTFVPAPAPASDINVSPRRKPKTEPKPKASEFMYRNDQPAIYSVAGSNRDSYTSVYTSNSADYINQTINYPDLVEPYENNEYHASQRQMSYNPMTTMDPTHVRRKSLTRSYSTSKGPDSIANHEGYKTAMYRTMFPSGNITDALSYYPTSSRYDSAVANLPQADYNDPSAWLNCPEAQYQESASTSSSMKSMDTSDMSYTQSPYMDRRMQQQNDSRLVQQPIYENQQQIDQQRAWNQRQEIPFLELDIRNRNVPDYVVQQQQQQHYDQSGIIMTQSGYITISSDTRQEAPREEKTKKPLKKGNTLKSAMSSVSHWLPDLHLKRNRSYSLPGGIRREDMEKTRNAHVKSNVASKKKKKNAIVSTMTGILQKAKRKTSSQSYSHSLSDPEQSDNEWNLQRTNSVVSEDDRSEDSCSVLSESQYESDLFVKVSNKPKIKKQSFSEASTIPVDDDQLQAQFDQMKVSPQLSDRTSKNTDPESCPGEEDYSGKSTGSGTSNMFPTVGENKRSSGSSEKSDETVVSESKMIVVVGGSSMEFAVSRALGKYRQRQTNSVSDDQICNGEQGVVIEEIDDNEDKLETAEKNIKLIEQASTESQNSDKSKNLFNEEQPVSEGSPASSMKLHMNRFLPRHQQSLEIPGHKEIDDDSRSTHSWRSTSRVSSRRQSTEDSIDSEDEWYCYELRKLEEMERQTQLEQEMGETLQELPEPEEDEEEPYEPNEEVKEKMGFVLRELRMKAKVVDGVLDQQENNLHTIQSAKRRESARNSFQLDSAASLFEKIKNYHGPINGSSMPIEHEPQPTLKIEEPEPEPELEPETAEEVEEDRRSHSSGDTSGPDSPQVSGDEYDEAEMAINDEFARCHITKEMQEMDENKEKPETPKEEATMSAIPKIQVESTGTPKEETPKEQGGPLGSKWKLLKTLKERKAEEKSIQGKTTEPTTEKEKVSMMGMMQKFYEIHVKT